jgi:hypothetical protein
MPECDCSILDIDMTMKCNNSPYRNQFEQIKRFCMPPNITVGAVPADGAKKVFYIFTRTRGKMCKLCDLDEKCMPVGVSKYHYAGQADQPRLLLSRNPFSQHGRNRLHQQRVYLSSISTRKCRRRSKVRFMNLL